MPDQTTPPTSPLQILSGTGGCLTLTIDDHSQRPWTDVDVLHHIEVDPLLNEAYTKLRAAGYPEDSAIRILLLWLMSFRMRVMALHEPIGLRIDPVTKPERIEPK